MKSYNQYCPIAHALDVVGERWTLLIVRELVEHGQLRYSDLHANLPHCGTNILAARLKELERNGVVTRRRLPPPAASTVYELTEYGRELRPVLHVLAHWGARSLGPPTDDTELEPGWLAGALEMALPGRSRRVARSSSTSATKSRPSSVGESQEGPLESPDAVIHCDRAGFYHLLVQRDVKCVTIEGDAERVRALLEALPYGESQAVAARSSGYGRTYEICIRSALVKNAGDDLRQRTRTRTSPSPLEPLT